MAKRKPKEEPPPRVIELDGRQYVAIPIEDWTTQNMQAVGPEGIGQQIKAMREEIGLSQRALRAAAGIRYETVNRIEGGRNTPDIATLAKIYAALDAAEQER